MHGDIYQRTLRFSSHLFSCFTAELELPIFLSWPVQPFRQFNRPSSAIFRVFCCCFTARERESRSFRSTDRNLPPYSSREFTEKLEDQYQDLDVEDHPARDLQFPIATCYFPHLYPPTSDRQEAAPPPRYIPPAYFPTSPRFPKPAFLPDTQQEFFPKPLKRTPLSKKLPPPKLSPPQEYKLAYTYTKHQYIQTYTISNNSTNYHHLIMSSSNPTNTKTAPFPTTNGAGPSKDSILNDLRRQLDDSDISSNAGSNSSGRRRRRRKNKSALSQPLAATAPAVLPRLADTKPVRLQLGLNLDIELELKARIQGDVSLTLL